MVKRKRHGKVTAQKPPSKLDRHPPYVENNDHKCVKFSLEFIQDDTKCDFTGLDKQSKAAFAEAMFRRRNITWGEIKTNKRHGLGFEMISKDRIKPSQQSLPEKMQMVENYMAFRYHGKLAMVGHREQDVFFVLWFDHNYHNRSVYGH